MRSPAARRAALERGVRAEALVADALGAQGWSVVDRNWRGGGGELDLVVRRGGAVRFVEVKARGPGDGTAIEAIGPQKRRRLAGAANAWLASHPEPEESAFLVAVVTLGEPPTIAWFDDAFDEV